MTNIKNILEKLNKLTLLYVEDDNQSREITLILLEDIFENIIVAVDGEDGLSKFKNNNIDLIITDINMPKIDGLDMSKEIKHISKDIPIIILSALTDITILKKAIDIGADSFLNKPLKDLNLLFSKLEQVLKKIDYDKTKFELEKAKQDKEKIKLVFKMIRNITHHWKQPLSVISLISSSYLLKSENGENLTSEELADSKIILESVIKLSEVLNKIETLDFDTISINEIEEIIETNNPIYER